MARPKAEHIARDQYAALAAAELAAELIADAESDTAGIDRIVLEAVGEESWDDIVLSNNPDSALPGFKNWQVKRQTTPLSKDIMSAAVIGIFNRQQQALADQMTSPEFHLGLESLVDIELSKHRALRLTTLHHMCDKLRNAHVDRQQFLSAIQGPEQQWIDYIVGIGLITDPGEVLGLLSTLHVHRLGSREEIHARGVRALTDKYDEPAKVFEQLYRYLVVNTDPAFRFDYKTLEENLLHEHKKSHKQLTWMRISQPSGTREWILRGTLSLDALAATVWRTTSVPSTIKLQLRPTRHLTVPEKIILRLMAHRTPLARLEIAYRDEWKQRLEKICGGTLGSTPNVRSTFATTSNPDGRGSSVAITLDQPETITETICEQMDVLFYEMITTKVEQTLRDPFATFGLPRVSPDLLNMMNAEWNRWFAILNADAQVRAHFLRSLLATDSEWQRRTFDPSIRMGPQNADICAFAIFVGLAISVATTGALQFAHESDAANLLFNGKMPCHLVALQYVSALESDEPTKIAYAGADLLLGPNTLVILAGSDASLGELLTYNQDNSHSFNVDDSDIQNFQNLYTNSAILTASRDLVHAMQSGADAVGIVVASSLQAALGTGTSIYVPVKGGSHV